MLNNGYLLILDLKLQVNWTQNDRRFNNYFIKKDYVLK